MKEPFENFERLEFSSDGPNSPLYVNLYREIPGSSHPSTDHTASMAFYTHIGIFEIPLISPRLAIFQVPINFVHSRIGEPNFWPIVGIAREVSTDSSSKDCLDLISAWIKDCARNHPACHRPDAQPLPTRVIKVGSKNSELRLYASKNESSRYISLSHCWGGVKSMMLTKDNFNRMIAGIPFAGLPKTFSDAIDMTRRLGVPYLWIDSLCIIQDSAEDWEIEAAKMSDIYANAYLTIAADGAANSHGGCYVAGKDRDTKVTEVKCTDIFGDKCHVYIRPDTGYPEQVHIPAHERTRVGLYSTLASRAWVLQERVLSHRTLHFTSKEATWECETLIRCECQVRPMETTQWNSKHRYFQRSSGAASQPGSGLLEWGSPQSSSNSARTHLTVQNAFTQLDLTFSSDRLPAIGGLAAAYAKSTRYTYLAGLWKEDLPSALLWEFDRQSITKRTSRRHENYYAPTWSWASITGPIKCGWQPFDDIMDFEVLAAGCVPAGKNPYGSVRSGFIEGIGVVAPVRLGKLVPTDSAEISETGEGYVVLPSSSTISNEGLDKHQLDAAFNPDVQGYTSEIVEGEQYFLLVISQSETGESSIVVRPSSATANSYERVGSCRTLLSKEFWVKQGRRERVVLV